MYMYGTRTYLLHFNFAACVVEEFHSPGDECSGILATDGTVYGDTQFNVTVTNIASVGNAVLIRNPLEFCGEGTLGGTQSDMINCTALLSSSLDLVSFQCEGYESRVPAGPAWIVFERNLTSTENCSGRYEDLTPSRRFFANYSGFEIHWSPNCKCGRDTCMHSCASQVPS